VVDVIVVKIHERFTWPKTSVKRGTSFYY